jgi:hypothetical protein
MNWLKVFFFFFSSSSSSSSSFGGQEKGVGYILRVPDKTNGEHNILVQ